MRLLNPNGKFKMEVGLAMARSQGRCQAYPSVGIQCHRPATEVWEVEQPGVFVAFCRECRRRGVGASPVEKRQATRQARGRQLSLVGSDK